jgi:ATP-dependent DNA ligase
MTKANQIMPARCKHSLTLDQARKQWRKIDPRYIYEVKEDGNRYLLQVRPNGSKQNFLTSRRISKLTGELVEKQDRLTKVRDYKFPKEWSGVIFDGEWTGGADSNETAHAIAQGAGTFVVWDIIHNGESDITNLNLIVRRNLLKSLRPFFAPWMEPIWSTHNPIEAFAYVREHRLEGLVRKNLLAPYGIDWTKAKAEFTYDVVVWDYEDTKSADWQAKGWIGAVKFGQWRRTRFIDSDWNPWTPGGPAPNPGEIATFKGKAYEFVDCGRCSGMTQAVREEISDNKMVYRGDVIEITCKKRFESGKFRHPEFSRFRPDKSNIECIMDLV